MSVMKSEGWPSVPRRWRPWRGPREAGKTKKEKGLETLVNKKRKESKETKCPEEGRVEEKRGNRPARSCTTSPWGKRRTQSRVKKGGSSGGNRPDQPNRPPYLMGGIRNKSLTGQRCLKVPARRALKLPGRGSEKGGEGPKARGSGRSPQKIRLEDYYPENSTFRSRNTQKIV